MAHTLNDLERTNPLRHIGSRPLEILMAHTDLDGILTATALAPGFLQPNGAYIAENIVPTTGHVTLLFPIRPTVTLSVGTDTYDIELIGINHLGERVTDRYSKTGTTTVQRTFVHFVTTIISIQITASGSTLGGPATGTITIGFDHPATNQIIPLPYIPQVAQPAVAGVVSRGDIAGLMLLDGGGGTWSIPASTLIAINALFSTNVSLRQLTYANVQGGQPTAPVLYRIYPNFRASFFADMIR